MSISYSIKIKNAYTYALIPQTSSCPGVSLKAVNKFVAWCLVKHGD